MQTLVRTEPAKGRHRQPADPSVHLPKHGSPRLITGIHQHIIRRLIWIQIFWLCLFRYKNPLRAFRKAASLKATRSMYRQNKLLRKYVKAGNRYFVNYNTPGWPSAAFNRYVKHYLSRFNNETGTLASLVFAITKKCGYQCEHCCEWLNLNKADKLSREQLLEIIRNFHGLGISQVQLSGGEPLNRLRDILFLLDNSPRGIDFWIYTSGHSLTPARALLLRRHGLTGITISLDHHIEKHHNEFRGIANAYRRALDAQAYARDAGLATCFSLCATRDFVSRENLTAYMNLARKAGVSFVQALEPKAVGRYAGKDVALGIQQTSLLEEFYQAYNYDPTYSHYPAIAYHGHTGRNFGCSGSGVDYVYADTDGDIHSCPFCQRKLFSALDPSLASLVGMMKQKGCNAFSTCDAGK